MSKKRFCIKFDTLEQTAGEILIGTPLNFSTIFLSFLKFSLIVMNMDIR